MEIVYENGYEVTPQNPCVVDYKKRTNHNGMSIMHYHSYYEIFFLISGESKFFFQNKILNLRCGNVIIIKPNKAHRAVPLKKINVGEYERYLINVDASLFSKIEKNNKIVNLILEKEIISIDSKNLSEIIDIIKKIDYETSLNTDKYYYSIKNHIERILIDRKSVV